MTDFLEMLNKPLPPSAALDPLIFIGSVAAIAGWYIIIRYWDHSKDKKDNSGS